MRRGTTIERWGIGASRWGVAALVLAVAWPVRADVVADANARAAEIASRHPATPVAVRMMAAVQVSVFEAVNAITGRYPRHHQAIQAAPDASVDAAVAAATRLALSRLDTPMHPEYPCAHCVVSAALGAVLAAEIGPGPSPRLSSTSPTAGNEARTRESVDDFTREVALARIYDGVQYRFSTVAGSAMGRRIGERAVRSMPRAAR